MTERLKARPPYIGRFAPSPTGPLHFGSLFAAIASYVDAKANNGLWLMRMEDLDPPREPEGAADLILQQLYDFSLHWDGEVLYQSSRLQAYEDAINRLRDEKLCYHCACTRPQVKAMGSVYDGHCRQLGLSDNAETAVRILTEPREITFSDRVFGNTGQNIEKDVGDFIIKRKDGLHAYQIAVVVDDEYQQINHIVRGADLLESTPRQIFLQEKLGYATPDYCHVPILLNAEGQKLSKQHFARAITSEDAKDLIFRALTLLGQRPSTGIRKEQPATQLSWAIEHWDIQAVPKLANIPL